jgi:4-hydroxy-4-methyl-2-oxoglutarate aldolase
VTDEPHTLPRPGSVALDSCDLSDACDRLGIEAVRTGALRPLWPGCAALSGRLTTVRLEPGTGTPLRELLDVLARAAGGVVLVDLRGRVDVQCWGTVLATAARQFGVRGALVNGAARDVDGLRELGLPAYARGVFPGAVRGRLGVVAVGEPVDFDGAAVESGCFAAADGSGAVFLPCERVEEVVALAAELRAREDEQLRAIAAGADPRAVLDSPRQARQP